MTEQRSVASGIDQTLRDRAVFAVGWMQCRNVDAIETLYKMLVRVKEESTSPVLPDLLAALGWQGGTIHDALAEVRKMKSGIDELKTDIATLKQKNQIHRDKANGDYWAWGDDGEDHPESLVCPILISADAMRGILAEVRQLKIDSANYRGKCDTCDAACCDMLTDSQCVVCQNNELQAEVRRLREGRK